MQNGFFYYKLYILTICQLVKKKKIVINCFCGYQSFSQHFTKWMLTQGRQSLCIRISNFHFGEPIRMTNVSS